MGTRAACLTLFHQRQSCLESWRSRTAVRNQYPNLPPERFDFGEGTVPTVTYANLQQFIYGVANTASETFPSNANEPFNFLNLDVYAQDTWKVTRKLTWTSGLRDTFNSNPLNPHDEVARLRGSFGSISHDVKQPLSAAIQTLWDICSRPRHWPFCNREWRLPGSSSRKRCCELGSVSSATYCRAAWLT
jgi:hypothetical protein